ncbi:hypothetical protein O0235_10765 [Tepidiforma flava]|uniref:Uncharacterized protein n=1 Tax=Tepidiforma flava TaxID=3004094 RepID=A0ABY7M4M3_9CHLR|nr:hypothetical protein [Tepidiforma flava]WBL35267.1 hypothetical protein O0235_10765 [Tepidiforma flava]
MTNETNLDEMTPEERAKLKKQLTEQAVKLAVNWPLAGSRAGEPGVHAALRERSGRVQPAGEGR